MPSSRKYLTLITLLGTLTLSGQEYLKMLDTINYFPPESYRREILSEIEIDSFRMFYDSYALWEFNEEKIFGIKDTNVSIIRLAILPPFSGKVIVQLTRTGENSILEVRSERDYKMKKEYFNFSLLSKSEQRILSKHLKNEELNKDVMRFYEKAGITDSMKFRFRTFIVDVDSLKFQSMIQSLASNMENSPSILKYKSAFDGTNIILEIYSEGNYKNYSRHSGNTEQSFEASCRDIVELAKTYIPDIVKHLDRNRSQQ